MEGSKMKKCVLFILMIMTGFFPAAFADEGNPCKNIDMGWLRTHSPIPSCSIASKVSVGSLCQLILKIGSEYVPVFAGDDFIIAGEMLQHRKQVTKERIDALKAEDYKKLVPDLPSVAAITYIPAEKTNRTIYMVSDPLCSYCAMAAKRIINLADTYDATIKTVLYSVHGTDGEQKVVEAVCRNFTLDQYSEDEWKAAPFDESYRCEKGETLLEKTRELIGRSGISGVPAFIFDDGQFVTGADMTTVERLLQNSIQVK